MIKMLVELLKISGNCSDPGLAALLAMVKRFVNILWIVGPILAIIGCVIAFIKLLNNPEEKKYKTLFKNMIIALIILFFLPVIVNVVMRMFDGQFNIASCWNQAEMINETGSQKSQYIDPNGQKKKNPLNIDPSSYITDDKPSNNGSTSSSRNNANSSSTGTTSSGTTSNKKIIFIGDSRTVGMKSAVGNEGKNDIWSCKSSMGLDWMKNTGFPAIESQITNEAHIVILMGVNDLYHVNDYITYLNSLVSKVNQKGGKLYFVSVNPTSRSADYLNDQIDEFNEKMKKGLSSQIVYIDTNSYLIQNSFSSGDGIHYTNTTYKQIYNLIKGNI